METGKIGLVMIQTGLVMIHC